MANVFVMRRHVNGNLTAGVYLVDLLCLGIKDTLYIFNETEAEVKERTGDDFDKTFMEIDYNLAHNIIYAGHDFAMDYEIKPHADFAITKFVLEEDNDDIPLIEIEVGQDDKPHLMVYQAGQYSDALAKLKKIAGEGNYYYTIGAEFEEDDDDEDDDDDFEEDDDDVEIEDSADDDDDAYYDMDEFDLGEITPLQAKYIYTDDLINDERVAARVENEILTIQTEVALRTLREIDAAYFAHDDKEEADLELLENENYSSGVTEAQEDTVAAMQEEMLKFYEARQVDEDYESITKFLLEKLEQNKTNPVIVANIFENGFFREEKELVEVAKGHLENLSEQYPLAKLTLAFAAYINNEDKTPYEFIYNSESLADAFADKNDIGECDINTYGLLQTMIKLSQADLRLAVYYYYYAAETEVFSWLLPFVQSVLMEAIAKVAEDNPIEDDTDEEDADEEETEDDDENDNEDKPTLRIV